MAASSGPKGLPDICVSAATLPNVPTTTAKTSWDAWQGIFDNLPGTFRGLVPMRAGGGRNQGASQLYGRRSLLSQSFAIGALMLPDVASGQVTVWRSTVKSPRTEIMKPMLLIVTAIVALGSIVARADAIDTEHLFGFTIGTDVGEIGEREFESNTLSRLGKRSGSYSALSQSLSLEYTAVHNLRLEVSATGVYYDVVGVPGLDDRRRGR